MRLVIDLLRLTIRVVGVPDLLAVIPAAVPADKAGRERAVPAKRATGTLPPGQLRLHLLKLIRRDYGLVIAFHIILGYLTLVLLVLLRQEVHGEGFLEQRVAFVLLVPQYSGFDTMCAVGASWVKMGAS